METFSRGEIVQFGPNHKWCGCLGIVEEAKPLKDMIRYMVGVPMPPGPEQEEDGYRTAYIFATGDDLMKLFIMCSRDGEMLRFPNLMYPASMITPFNTEEENDDCNSGDGDNGLFPL